MREQATMTPSTGRGRINGEPTGIFRGKILANGVSYRDVNGAKQTLVDLYMYDLLPLLHGVPLMASKINKDNGYYEDPEPGDLVVVAFFGDIRDPIVIGFIPPADNGIQSMSTEAPQTHRRRNGTDEKIGKDGTRTVYIAKDDNLEVVGNGTITIHGNATVNVLGDTVVNTPNATVNASQQVTLNTPLTKLTGDLAVAGGISAAGSFGSSGGKISTPGDIQSTGGDVSDQTRSMSADRAIYNSHTHTDPQGGTVGTPSPKE